MGDPASDAGLSGQAALLQTVAGRSVDTATLVVLVGGMIAAVALGGLILVAMRRRLLSKDSAAAAAGSLMDELRAARDRGELSEEEFQSARGKITAKMATEFGVGKTGVGGRSPPKPAVRPAATRLEGAKGVVLRAPPGVDLTGSPLPRPHNFDE